VDPTPRFDVSWALEGFGSDAQLSVLRCGMALFFSLPWSFSCSEASLILLFCLPFPFFYFLIFDIEFGADVAVNGGRPVREAKLLTQPTLFCHLQSLVTAGESSCVFLKRDEVPGSHFPLLKAVGMGGRMQAPTASDRACGGCKNGVEMDGMVDCDWCRERPESCLGGSGSVQ
jgi:hypothetical protein